jgi:hypothetical protein
LDPGVLAAVAVKAGAGDRDAVRPEEHARWLRLVVGEGEAEHVVLSDGLRRIRLDLTAGSLRGGAVVLHYNLSGTVSLAPKLLPLRRLSALFGTGRFAASLFPHDPRMTRSLEILRIHDALQANASHSEIARVVYDCELRERWRDGAADSVRSRLRRRIREARVLADGGWRKLLNAGS